MFTRRHEVPVVSPRDEARERASSVGQKGKPKPRTQRHFDTMEDGRNQCQNRSSRHLQ